MPAATLTSKGQVVIPADIRSRYGLTAGTQVEFVDTGDSILLKVRRRIPETSTDSGFGMLKVNPSLKLGDKLSDFDPAVLASNDRS